MANRAAAEAIILEGINDLIPGGPSVEIYKNLFASMDNEQFDEFMETIHNGPVRLPILAPNMSKHQLSVERNLELAKKYNHNFFQRVWMDPGKEVPMYLTNKPLLIVDLPLRLQAQLQDKKISIPRDNKSIDELTGQPSGASKGSKISYPETQIMAALNMPESITEMLKYRGGDVKAFDAMNKAIDRQGSVSMAAIEHLTDQVQSARTLKTFLMCMHIDSTLT